MISEAELIVDRRKLRRRVTFWRILAIVLAIATVAALAWSQGWTGGDQIARVRIDGVITGDQKTMDLLKRVEREDRVKAVILRIDSPGGTTAGSEAVYDAVRKISARKPVVAVMDTVAASGGYITALAADRIVARGNTITGSIGVVFSMPEFSQLLDTVGIQMEELKSGDLKAEPSPYKPMTEKARTASMELVMDGFSWFKGLVAERRKLPMPAVDVLSDGRVYTGRQAVANKLIDELGDEGTAVAWMEKDKAVSANLPVRDWRPESEREGLGLGFSAAGLILKSLGLKGFQEAAQRAQLDGLLVLWHPAQ
ncbi:MAG: signal peptide peptidase SppA [Aestuariivirga sp.]|uniref:signal peptide peptidase SppA n=1 Tax=Aestuariivirga sp. TaxID=2650926 RepID=UPI0025BA94EF|nr:signal peptide peptidase SppA [Aestuariivirga sp.]MCA3559645.1 signal peptide peptidase SppA [Aestuariivirga sp.]